MNNYSCINCSGQVFNLKKPEHSKCLKVQEKNKNSDKNSGKRKEVKSLKNLTR